MKSIKFASLCALTETVLLFVIQIAAFKIAFPQKGLFGPLGPYVHMSIVNVLFRETIIVLMVRVAALNIPLNILLQHIYIRRAGPNAAIIVLTAINIGTFLMTAGALALFVPSTREYWILDPIIDRLFMYGTVLGCAISPLLVSNLFFRRRHLNELQPAQPVG